MDVELEDYFNNINLNKDLLDFYKIINDDDLTEDFLEQTKLTDIRNENYMLYTNISLTNLADLPESFNQIVKEIKDMYLLVESRNLLIENMENAKNSRKIIDSIHFYLKKLDEMIEYELDKLEKYNEEKQEQLKNIKLTDIDKNTLNIFCNKYNDLVLFNSMIETDLYTNYKRQLTRKNYLKDLYRIINVETSDFFELELLKKMKIQIEIKIEEIQGIISYLESVMINKSKYKQEFINFKDEFSRLIAYDDTDYLDINRIHHLLYKDAKINSMLEYFEHSFENEIKMKNNLKKFIYEKTGIRNMKLSLDCILENYMDYLTDNDRKLINSIQENIINETNIEASYNVLKKIVNNIWEQEITDIYSYNINDNFAFICANNQFIDEKYQTILITRRMLDKVQDYTNYQIGFICDYADNILYITENDNIMEVTYSDMSDLKTPKQIENEFEVKICNRIALDGYNTKISAVYFIDDGDIIKYKKAVELANQYCLPLISLKK